MTQDELLALIDQAEREGWTELDLSGKGINELPLEIGKLKMLERLYLSDNQISDLPESIKELLSLKILNLHNNLIELFPEILVALKKLERLYLSDNNIVLLSETISKLSNLKRFNLKNNKLATLPDSIGLLTSLEYLNLWNNELQELPITIGNLLSLETLILRYNQLSEFPQSIGQLKKLSKLDVQSNRFGTLPHKIGELSNLVHLNLARNEIKDVPDSIGKLQNLVAFSLRENRLQSLPDGIGKLSNLLVLDVDYNQIQQLPEAICKLYKLRRLHIDHNQIRHLPSAFGFLTSLQLIDANHNQLSELPESIEGLTNLRSLNVRNNCLYQLPTTIGQLTNLSTINLNNNKLEILPSSFKNLQNLQVFLAQNNLFTHMPYAVSDLDSLRVLGIANNPLDHFPVEIIRLGINAVKKYLSLIQTKYKDIWESKLLLIGEGGVGKTTLLQVLNNYPFNHDEIGTVGIEISTFDLPHPEKDHISMQLNCWDFAGQDFNHAMHQFFFSNRSLFLLVWNARHGWQQGKLYQWLENIKVRAPRAKVILVATHTDQPHSDYPAADLQAKYPQIVDTIEVSSKTGDNIPELRQLIQKHAADLPLMGLRWPQTWLDAANAVRAMCEAGQKHASRREVVNVMKAHDLNEEECDILMRWLHELGDILHFDDEPEMRGRVILDPEWLTQHIGIVLRSDEVQEQNGILTRQHLDKLWDDLDDFLRDHFLRMMDKFDLAYLIPDDPQDRSLIVERLPLDPPDFAPQWQEFEERGNEISLRFKLGSLQPGIPTWFIARCHRFTMNTHWLNGVLFKDEDDRHRALIIADDRDNMVQMTVRGPFPQRFMSLLRDGFRDTLKRYKGLEVIRKVPCPGGHNDLVDGPCLHEFDLDNLEKWIIKRPEEDTVPCPYCGESFSRLRLVEGIGAASLTQDLTEQRIIEVIREESQLTRLHLDIQITNLIKYHERNFLRAFYLEQDREMVTCPNLFTVRQVPKSGVVKKQEWHIQLYCQQPGAWHPVGEPYIIEEQKEWFTKALPYLKTLLKVLSVVAPLANAALAITDVVGDKVQFAHDQHVTFENEVKMMGELLKGAKVVAEMERPFGERIHDLPERSTFRKAEGAELVPIRDFMDQLAEIDEQKGRPKWAGLTRRQTPEGDILWLDEEHLQEYLSKRKPVPQPEDFE